MDAQTRGPFEETDAGFDQRVEPIARSFGAMDAPRTETLIIDGRRRVRVGNDVRHRLRAVRDRLPGPAT